MIQKLVIALGVLLLGVLLLGVTAASAQSCQDAIDKRQTFMKHSAAEAKIGSSMIKGEIPFDLAKTKEIYAAFAADAAAMPTLFPDCSKTGDHTTAAPAVWEKSADFKAAIAKFTADIKAAQDSTKDLDSLKVNFQTIGKDCGSCHQTFRVKPS
jgi:cytochrome c556